MCEAWIGFTGAVIGGILTCIGVLITIQYYKKQETENRNNEYRKGQLIFYRFLQGKVCLLNIIYSKFKEIKNEQGKCEIHVGKVFSSEENLFLYEKMHYLDNVLSDEDLRTIMAFIGQLREYDTVREVCIDEMDNKGTLYSGGIYEEQLTACYKILVGNEDSQQKGIIDLLGELEKHLGLNEK